MQTYAQLDTLEFISPEFDWKLNHFQFNTFDNVIVCETVLHFADKNNLYINSLLVTKSEPPA